MAGVSVTDLRDNILALDIREEAVMALEDSRQVMVQKQTDQLLHGLRPDGKIIGRYRNKKYAAAKHALNPLAGEGNMDWKLRGDLHRELFVDVRQDEYVVDSADRKTGDLIKRFGDPFGLSEKSIGELVDEKLEDALIDRVRDKTGL